MIIIYKIQMQVKIDNEGMSHLPLELCLHFFHMLANSKWPDLDTRTYEKC